MKGICCFYFSKHHTRNKSIMLLSIIIPVYNVRVEIEKLLNNLVNQMTTDVEIILVDDGSTDGSLEVCNTFAHENVNIKVLYQQNSGCYMARQKALDASKGKYITFIDSDDLIDASYIDILRTELMRCKNYDIYVFGYNQKYPKDFLSFYNKDKEYDVCDYYRDILTHTIQGPFALWNHVYSKSFLDKNGICFNVSFKKAGDAVFNDLCLLAEPRIFTSSKIVYTWVCGHESLTCKFEPTMWKTIEEHERHLDELFLKYCDGIYLKKELNGIKWYYFNYLFSNIYESNLSRIDKRINYRIILKNNIDKMIAKENLNGLRQIIMNLAIQYNQPFWLCLWRCTYASSWIVFAAKIYHCLMRKVKKIIRSII